MSHQKYIFSYCTINDEVPSTSSQIVEQIKVILEVVLARMSDLNNSAISQQ